jgi:hypothetical protein
MTLPFHLRGRGTHLGGAGDNVYSDCTIEYSSKSQTDSIGSPLVDSKGARLTPNLRRCCHQLPVTRPAAHPPPSSWRRGLTARMACKTRILP